MTKQRRQDALYHGLRSEWVAAMLLRAKGYRILVRNYSVPGGEIDIIAQRGTVIAFVEVKARPTFLRAMASIDDTKRRRMSRAAAHWLAGKDWAQACVLRGDAICIMPWKWPQHVAGAVTLRLG